MFATVPQFMSSVPEPGALAIDALSQDWQGGGGRCACFHHFPCSINQLNKVIQKLMTTRTGEVILIAPWWLSQPCFPNLLRLCGSPTILSVPQRPVVTTGLYLEQQVVPSARMEAFMQHTGKGFDQLGPTAAQIAAFLYELFDTHGLLPQTIKAQVLSSLGP